MSEQLTTVLDDKTHHLIGYRTTNGKMFTSLQDAITEQVAYSANHTPLDNFVVVFRENKSYPFFEKGFNSPIKYLYGNDKPDSSERLFMRHNYDRAIKTVTALNNTGKTVLLIDKSSDTVYLVPTGMEMEIREDK